MNFNRNSAIIIHCTQAKKSGAAKYVNELFSAVRTLIPNARLVCPADFEHRHLHPGSSLACFAPLQGVGRMQKLLSMCRQFSHMNREIINISQEAKLAIVHFNFPFLHFLALLQIIVLKSKRLIVVLTIHDVIPHRWVFPSCLNGVERWVLKTLYRAADAVLVHHVSQRDTIQAEFGVPSDKVRIIHHGVFRLSNAPLPYQSEGEFVALCFGAIRENKGHHLSIEAIQRLRAAGKPARLLIAGSASFGEQKYWDSCKELIAKRPEGIEVFDGYIHDEDVISIFQRCSFVLLPYSDFFSQSGVATMALSSGRAIVSTDSGGLTEMLADGRFGVKIEAPTVDSVEAALLKSVLIGHAKLAETGTEAYAYFHDNYSWEKAAELQCRIYDELIDNRMMCV